MAAKTALTDRTKTNAYFPAAAAAAIRLRPVHCDNVRIAAVSMNSNATMRRIAFRALCCATDIPIVLMTRMNRHANVRILITQHAAERISSNVRTVCASIRMPFAMRVWTAAMVPTSNVALFGLRPAMERRLNRNSVACPVNVCPPAGNAMAFWTVRMAVMRSHALPFSVPPRFSAVHSASASIVSSSAMVTIIAVTMQTKCTAMARCRLQAPMPTRSIRKSLAAKWTVKHERRQCFNVPAIRPFACRCRFAVMAPRNVRMATMRPTVGPVAIRTNSSA